MYNNRSLLCAASIGICSIIAQAATPQHAQPMTADSFVMKATAASLAELGFGQLASTEVISKDLRKVVGQLIQDQTKLNKELTTIAESKHISPAKELDKQHKELEQRLWSLSGSNFEKEYVKVELRDSQDELNLFEGYVQSGKDPELKSLATKALPTLKHHLSLIQGLASKGL